MDRSEFKRRNPKSKGKVRNRLAVIDKMFGRGFTQHGFFPVPRPLLTCFEDLGLSHQLRDFIIYVLAFGTKKRGGIGDIIADDTFIGMKMKYSRKQVLNIKRKLERITYKGKALVTISAPFIKQPKGVDHPLRARTTYNFNYLIKSMNELHRKHRDKSKLTYSR